MAELRGKPRVAGAGYDNQCSDKGLEKHSASISAEG